MTPGTCRDACRGFAGDSLHVTDLADGIKLTAYDPAFARQMEVAEDVMRRRRTLLRKLAE